MSFLHSFIHFKPLKSPSAILSPFPSELRLKRFWKHMLLLNSTLSEKIRLRPKVRIRNISGRITFCLPFEYKHVPAYGGGSLLLGAKLLYEPVCPSLTQFLYFDLKPNITALYRKFYKTTNSFPSFLPIFSSKYDQRRIQGGHRGIRPPP